MSVDWQKTAFFSLVLILSVARLLGEDISAPFTLDVPVSSPVQMPSWLSGLLLNPSSSSFVITVSAESALAVTVYFDDPAANGGSFLRVTARDARGERILSSNLLEGAGALNQRTLFFSCKGSTTVLIESSAPPFPVRRLHFEWTEANTVAAGAEASVPAVFLQSGRSISKAEAEGRAFIPQPDRWQNKIVTATLSAAPTRLDAATAFIAPFSLVPGWVRVEGFFAGGSIRHAPILWINGREVGELALERPSLIDAGWFWSSGDGSKEPIYAGWLKGSAYVSADFFSIGDNRFQFALSEGVGATSIKELKVEVLPSDAVMAFSGLEARTASPDVFHVADVPSP